MKILYVYPWCGLGGVEVTVINKINALKNIGIHGKAIFLDRPFESGKYMLNDNVKCNLTPMEILSILKKKFDIITLIDYPQFLNVISRFSNESKVIYETHCSAEYQVEESYKVLNHNKISAILVPSQFNVKNILKLSKTDKKIFVLPNPIDTNIFKNIPLSNIQNSYSEYLNRTNIIWVGRLDKGKNAMELVEIGCNLLKKNKNLHFFIIGELSVNIEYFQSVKKSIPQNFNSNFTFIPGIPNEKMPEIYSLAANTGGCLVSTSKHESLPMIFIEAMCCKCPVVSTDVGGVREVIINNKTGKIYNLNDINDGTTAISELIDKNNYTLRNKIINNAYYLAKTRHSLESVTARYKSILDYVLNNF
ncbi:glycosyltransferase family 4 protein [Clostridium sp. SYSU_GA19001]|uniref:glycosyltransferase family 4 protein n=1 Tax=Clostridium caldaquaticum TaxID=2940653 RepID=UPI00207777F4|nr:glycosyltransferase family 4 protein [Clostridium caldaquaticum]MCM8711964.1 glycosyltransferase family 4 protein [Clostridium caldaquaticum]